MSQDHPPQNVQAGVPLAAEDESQHEVATGDRRDQMHYQPDPDQLVKAKSLVRPDGPIPPEEHTEQVDARRLGETPYVGDVQVAPDGPSVWDARPPPEDEDHERSGNPTGH